MSEGLPFSPPPPRWRAEGRATRAERKRCASITVAMAWSDHRLAMKSKREMRRRAFNDEADVLEARDKWRLHVCGRNRLMKAARKILPKIYPIEDKAP